MSLKYILNVELIQKSDRLDVRGKKRDKMDGT